MTFLTVVDIVLIISSWFVWLLVGFVIGYKEKMKWGNRNDK